MTGNSEDKANKQILKVLAGERTMSGKEKLVVWLEDVRNTDIPIVGGKGASLGEMINAELPVPRGFVVTAQAFRKFIDEAGIADKLFKGLEVDVDDQKELMKAEEFAKGLIKGQPMPKVIADEIRKDYETMCQREGGEVYVAARSSATAEDLPEASFAGQQETYLNVRGADELLQAVQNCWASLYGARAIYYRVKQKFPHEHVNIAVVVQKMVDADSAGVMFTSHPTTGENMEIIEAAWGLGESVVSGSVSPDNYVVKDGKIIQKKIATKQIMIIRDKKTRKTKKIDVPEDRKNVQVLSEDEIHKLSTLGKIVEEHYGKPQDIEWAVQNGEIYLLQSRPITTIQKREAKGGKASGEIILEGLGASPGVASGKVKIVKSMDMLDRVLEGDILVTRMTTPDMVPAMKRSAAIVTDEGGLTCHAAIVSRELGTPAVVGTKEATKILQDEQVITVDGEMGNVYLGAMKKEAPAEKGEEAAVSEDRRDQADHRDRSEGQRLHPRGGAAGEADHGRRRRAAPHRAHDPGPQQAPRIVHEGGQVRRVRGRISQRHPDGRRRLLPEAGVGPDAGRAHGRVPGHEGRRERAVRAQPHAGHAGHPA